MRSSTIKATYLPTADAGQNSLGFKPGTTYTLAVATFEQRADCMLQIRNTQPPHQVCPYGSWHRFLDFWGDITKVA